MVYCSDKKSVSTKDSDVQALEAALSAYPELAMQPPLDPTILEQVRSIVIGPESNNEKHRRLRTTLTFKRNLDATEIVTLRKRLERAIEATPEGMHASAERAIAKGELGEIIKQYDEALGHAHARFAEVIQSISPKPAAPPAEEESFWAAVESTVALARRFYASVERWGLSWTAEEERAKVAQILHSASGDLADGHRVLILGHLQKLTDAWTPEPFAKEGPLVVPDVEAMNLRRVGALALALAADEGIGPSSGSGAPGNPFKDLANAMGDLFEFAGVYWRSAEALPAQPILVSSLVDPRLAAACVVRETSAHLMQPASDEMLSTALQTLCLSRQGVLSDERVGRQVFADRPQLMELHRAWRNLAQTEPDPAERAFHGKDLLQASPGAQLEWSAYILSGEIEGSVERILPELASAEPRGRDALWWAYRFAYHYASLQGPRSARFLHAEQRTRAEAG